MTTPKHTPGPYRANLDRVEAADRPVVIARCDIIDYNNGGDEINGIDEANAARIAAALNACDGYEDPEDMAREAWLLRDGFKLFAMGRGCPIRIMESVYHQPIAMLNHDATWTPAARAAVDKLRGKS